MTDFFWFIIALLPSGHLYYQNYRKKNNPFQTSIHQINIISPVHLTLYVRYSKIFIQKSTNNIKKG